MITPEKFGKILNKLPKEKTELSSLEKVELNLKNAESFISQAKKNTSNKNQSLASYKQIAKLATGELSKVKGGLKTAETLNKGLMKAYQEAKDIKKSMDQAGINSAPLDKRLKEIQNAGNDLQNNIIAFQNMENLFNRI